MNIAEQALTEEILKMVESTRSNTSIPSIQTIAAALNKEVLIRLANSAKSRLLEDLYLVGATDESVATDLVAVVEPTLTWVYNMLSKGMQELMTENNYRGKETLSHAKYEDIYLTGLDSNEETLCSAVLGMKGQIDMVARVKLISIRDPSAGLSAEVSTVDRNFQRVAESSLPVEIKTGKWRASTAIGHRAQVLLISSNYSLCCLLKICNICH